MESVNGTSEENTRRRYEAVRCQDERETLGQPGAHSANDGSWGESRSIEADSQRTDACWKLVPLRDTTAGKILERLESLESKHLGYVDSHQSRLKARLEESKKDKEEFLQESNQIKSDIYHLAIAQQKADENGHTN